MIYDFFSFRHVFNEVELAAELLTFFFLPRSTSREYLVGWIEYSYVHTRVAWRPVGGSHARHAETYMPADPHTSNHDICMYSMYVEYVLPNVRHLTNLQAGGGPVCRQ